MSNSIVIDKIEIWEEQGIYEKHDSLIQDQSLFQPPEPRIELQSSLPRFSWPAILLEEIYIQPQSRPRPIETNSTHLVVLVHGFQGNSMDMRSLRSSLAASFPNTIFISSILNEDNSDNDIWKQGEMLALEIKCFIQEWWADIIPNRISFIGHSLGGVVIRAALPHLTKLKPYFNFYMSLGTPHLGFMKNESMLIDTGLWLVQKWNKSQSLKQLTFQDAKDFRQTALFDLSMADGLDGFSHVFLVWSQQDSYVHFDSARIEVGNQIEDWKDPEVYLEMAGNILSRLKTVRIHKINVRYFLEDNSFDSYIGRSAHMMYLENK